LCNWNCKRQERPTIKVLQMHEDFSLELKTNKNDVN
jgi:hypothetical protein